MSEVSLVQDMYNGVKAMIDAEKALQPAKAVEVMCGSHLKGPEDLLVPGMKLAFPPGTKSLLSKFCT